MNREVFVHPKGICESESIGAGTRIWAFAHVLEGASVGRDCNICDGAFIEDQVELGDRVTVKNGVKLFDGVTIGDDVFLGHGTTFANDAYPRSQLREGTSHLLETKVGTGATLGANATILPGVTIGEWAMIGAGSVVTRDVPPHRLVIGAPARVAGWACRCGHRLDEALRCTDCGREFTLRGESIISLDS